MKVLFCGNCGQEGANHTVTRQCIDYLEAEHAAGRLTRDAKPKASRAHGISSPPGQMNKTELYYYRTVLHPKFLVNQYQAVLFEAVKLRLGFKCFYTPDFFCVDSIGQIELHEVKATGRWEDDARVKIQVAASLYPWFAFFGCEGKPDHPFEITPIESIPSRFE